MMLSCRDISLKANEYLEGELPWWTRAQIRVHVLMCERCRRFLAQLRLVIRSLRLLRQQDAATRKSEENIVHLLLQKHGNR